MPEDNFSAFWSGLFAQTPQEFVNAFNLFVGAEPERAGRIGSLAAFSAPDGEVYLCVACGGKTLKYKKPEIFLSDAVCCSYHLRSTAGIEEDAAAAGLTGQLLDSTLAAAQGADPQVLELVKKLKEHLIKKEWPELAFCSKTLPELCADMGAAAQPFEALTAAAEKLCAERFKRRNVLGRFDAAQNKIFLYVKPIEELYQSTCGYIAGADGLPVPILCYFKAVLGRELFHAAHYYLCCFKRPATALWYWNRKITPETACLKEGLAGSFEDFWIRRVLSWEFGLDWITADSLANRLVWDGLDAADLPWDPYAAVLKLDQSNRNAVLLASLTEGWKTTAEKYLKI